MNRAEFKNLALTRLDDSRVLVKSRRYSAAYYVAGYAIECALKACLAKKTQLYQFPPKPEEVKKRYYTHNLQILAEESGILQEIQKGQAKLREYWTAIKDWTEESRYDRGVAPRAKDLLKAIEDPGDGVLECIKRYW